ncbi:MAG TPA: O-antigen polymerase [Pyrinomonadaceae bacterium]|nr:O-antigen polymerase [Pyrinomonadaceae bacterium]
MTANRLPALIVALVWTIVILANLFLHPVLPAPPSLVTIGTCAFGAILLLVPSLLTTKTAGNEDQVKGRLFAPFTLWINATPHRISVLLIMGTLVGTLIDYSLAGAPSLSMAGSTEVSAVRAAHLAEGIAFSPLRYLSLTMKSIGLLSLAYIVVTRAPWPVTAGALLLTGLAGVVETATYGGRAFLRVTFSIVVAASIIGGAQWIIRHRTRVLTIVVVGILALITVNVWFNRLRVSNENEYVGTIRSGEVLAEAVGVGNLPNDVNFALGLVMGYLISPVGYFDHFLQVHNVPPGYGAFTFQTIGNRFGYDFLRVKEHVDDYYADFGITYNIWATAFRELMIDTGPYLFLPVCALLGVGFRLLRGHSSHNPGALLLYVLLFAWLLNSPFESIFKSRYVEFGFMLAALFAVVHVVALKWGGANRRRVRRVRRDFASNENKK